MSHQLLETLALVVGPLRQSRSDWELMTRMWVSSAWNTYLDVVSARIFREAEVSEIGNNVQKAMEFKFHVRDAEGYMSFRETKQAPESSSSLCPAPVPRSPDPMTSWFGAARFVHVMLTQGRFYEPPYPNGVPDPSFVLAARTPWSSDRPKKHCKRISSGTPKSLLPIHVSNAAEEPGVK